MWRLALVSMVACGRLGFDEVRSIGIDGAQVICPASYQRTDGGGCYRAETATTGRMWLDAEAICELEGGHLAIISSASELADVAVVLPDDIRDAFIGATDRIDEGIYLGIDGLPAYIEWSPGEPDGQEVSDCLEIRDTGFIGDTNCDGFEDFVCEIDGVAIDRASF